MTIDTTAIHFRSRNFAMTASVTCRTVEIETVVFGDVIHIDTRREIDSTQRSRRTTFRAVNNINPPGYIAANCVPDHLAAFRSWVGGRAILKAAKLDPGAKSFGKIREKHRVEQFDQAKLQRHRFIPASPRQDRKAAASARARHRWSHSCRRRAHEHHRHEHGIPTGEETKSGRIGRTALIIRPMNATSPMNL